MSILKPTADSAVDGQRRHADRLSRQSSEAYEQILSRTTSAPWNTDTGFQLVYDLICDHTLLDKNRCFELWQIVSQVSQLTEGAILQVGVGRGGTGALLARQAGNCSINNRVYLCDTFGEANRTSVEHIQHVISQVEVSNARILQGVFPKNTADQISNETFRLCHVDLRDYQSARNVDEWVWHRLVPGGIVVYENYGSEACDGVTRCVGEQRDRDDRVVFHNLNGHAVVVKPGKENAAPAEASPAAKSCEADAFMDEEDSEAVAERLRQLGYL